MIKILKKNIKYQKLKFIMMKKYQLILPKIKLEMGRLIIMLEKKIKIFNKRILYK